ncbi:MAG: hypothetical protein ACE5J3_14240 [Methanosarcinales archaeon]
MLAREITNMHSTSGSTWLNWTWNNHSDNLNNARISSALAINGTIMFNY